MQNNKEQINLYKVLGLKRDCSKNNIKKAFNKLIVKYHPDKGGDEEIYEIIVNAYTVLINDETRSQYDELYELENNSNSGYINIKEKSKDFLSNQNNILSKEDQINYKQAWDALNQKHGYYEENKDDMVIPKKECRERVKELNNQREKQYEKDLPEVLFNKNRPIPMEKFNAAFEASNTSVLDMVEKKEIPDAWNCQGGSITEYSSFDNLENLYDDSSDVSNVHGANYGTIHFDKKQKKKLTKNDIKNVGKAEYYNNHNKIDKNYYDDLKEKLRNRNLESNNFNNKELHQYDKNNTAGYGIFDKLGIKYDDKLKLSDWEDKNVNEAYHKLLQDRSRK